VETSQQPLQIAMLLFPGLTLLDLIGPQAVFSMHARTHLVWKTMDTVVSDSGIGMQPTATFDDCPKDLDVLFVPGGFGTAAAMRDPEVLSFLAEKAPRAKYVTSVCSGSLILGAAGLLNGYRATSHWALRDQLSMFGAEPVKARVVTDRNRITGGGVTAGIDFGLVLLARMRGDDAARLTQLAMEYDPAPPFNAGSPEGAGPDLVQQALSFMGSMDSEMSRLAQAPVKAS
jgi:cyclohexyl-isocyanide hydratase